MGKIIAVQKDDYDQHELGGGSWRWTAAEVYEQHNAQVSVILHGKGMSSPSHSHTVDEVILLLEGDMTLEGRDPRLPAGSVIFLGAHSAYGFTCGDEGVRWIMIRPRRPDVAVDSTDFRAGPPVAG